jgi:hypothetical protein
MTFARTILVAAAFGAGAAAFAADPPPVPSAPSTRDAPRYDPAWWDAAWQFRKAVRVAFPGQGNDLPVDFFRSKAAAKLLGERSLTAKAVVLFEEKGGQPSREVVVTDAGGTVIPSRAYASGWGKKVTVLFRAEPVTATYYIYYGNRKAKQSRLPWNRTSYPLVMVTVPVEKADAIASPASASRAVLAAPDAVRPAGKIGTYHVNNLTNPFGLEAGQHYVTLYTGLMYAPATGRYEFAVDAGGTAHLVIDGSLVLTANGGDEPARNWKTRSALNLRTGVHRFAILHGERADAQGIRVGWRQPGERDIVLMTGTAFARSNYIPVELVGFEEHGEAVTPFFTVDQPDVAFRLPNDRTRVPLRLNNLTAARNVAFRWTVGKQTYAGREPNVLAEAGGECEVVLEAFVGGKPAGEYRRSVSLRALRIVEPEVAVEMTSCPLVAYAGEKSGLTFKLTSLCDAALPIRAERRVGDDVTGTQIDLAPRASRPIEIALPALPKDQDVLDVTFRISAGPLELATRSLRVSRPGPHLAELKQHLGHLVDPDGRRVVILTGLEDEAKHRRWLILRWLAAQARAPAERILLFGDPMRNVADGPSPYVDRLRRQARALNRTLTFVESGQSRVVPCVGDIPAFATALDDHQPQLVVISPGSHDARSGVDRRTWARCLDVMIDLARARPNRPRIVLVTPPPLVNDLRTSQQLAKAMRAIARRHNLPCVDLHDLLVRGPRWRRAYQQDPSDLVFDLYPNANAQRAIANAIWERIGK